MRDAVQWDYEAGLSIVPQFPVSELCIAIIAQGPGQLQYTLTTEKKRDTYRRQHQGAVYLTHCGLVTPYGDRGLGLHWLR